MICDISEFKWEWYFGSVMFSCSHLNAWIIPFSRDFQRGVFCKCWASSNGQICETLSLNILWHRTVYVWVLLKCSALNHLIWNFISLVLSREWGNGMIINSCYIDHSPHSLLSTSKSLMCFTFLTFLTLFFTIWASARPRIVGLRTATSDNRSCVHNLNISHVFPYLSQKIMKHHADYDRPNLLSNMHYSLSIPSIKQLPSLQGNTAVSRRSDMQMAWEVHDVGPRIW